MHGQRGQFLNANCIVNDHSRMSKNSLQMLHFPSPKFLFLNLMSFQAYKLFVNCFRKSDEFKQNF